ncbi:MAG: hypothetical protein PHW40_00275 [Candidatus Izemoplasmatales bacterium]|jgi:hypothetical protein|nr:hypothetical protein [Candidatus Izemoplasmatales bacterium]
MKIKYGFKETIIHILLLLLVSYRFFIDLYEIFSLFEKAAIIAIILFEILYIGYKLFGTGIIIDDNSITSKCYFFKKSLIIDSSTKMIVKPFLRFLNKRLIIITNEDIIILWDIYSITLESICDEINKRIHDSSIK